MKTKTSMLVAISLVLCAVGGVAAANDAAYEAFYQRVLDEEAYIGFFAAEKKCISEVTPAYEAKRREFFLGIDTCEEDPGEFVEPFVEFCEEEGLLAEDAAEEWGRMLTIFGFVLYGNIGVFEYETDDVIAHRDLVFAEYPNKKLKLDLFLPKEPMDDPVPVVVGIHGGGWRVNQKYWFEPFAKYLAAQGIAAVTIDYRMLPAVTVMECVYDSKAAVRWVRANADTYGLDAERIGALGASAGAQLVALLGTTPNVAELEGIGGNAGVSSEVHAVVGFATPSFKMTEDSARFGRRFGITPEQMRMISPYENITKDAAPLYLVHGTTDGVVDPENSRDLKARYEEVGAPIELDWIEGRGHDFYEGSDLGIALAAKWFRKTFEK